MATSLFANPIMVEDYVETSKQITKALKCVAFTNMQVGDMMLRKHERLEKRIFSVSEEIELLKADVVENVVNQRERRQQLADIEDDIERAEVLGNALMVEELLEELKVLQDEGKREDALYRSLKKALRSRKRVRKEFIREKKGVEDEMRSFNRKQNLIQSLLTTFAKDSTSGAKSLSSDASQSDAGSTMTDFDESEFSVEPLVRRASDASGTKQRWLYSPEPVRPRRWSADEPAPHTPPKHRVRVRRTLSATFGPSRPHSLGSVEEEDEENLEDDDDDEAPKPHVKTSRSRPSAATAARTLTKSVSLPPQHHLFNEASTVARSVAAPAAAVRAAEPIELEEIHDEQDNYYSHASESSDESSDSDDDHDSTSVHTAATTASATTVAHDTVVIGAGVQSVLAHEMHTLKLSTEVAAAVASVKATTHTADTRAASSDQVEVALALSEMVQSISTTLAA